MKICFDMDGSIADLYEVEGWLDYLIAEDPRPYQVANPLWNMDELNFLLTQLQGFGIEICIITWLSKNSSENFKKATRKAKRDWLEEVNFPFDHFHGVQYGAKKSNSIKHYLEEDEEAILIDDDARVRDSWTVGRTIDPKETNIEIFLQKLLEEIKGVD